MKGKAAEALWPLQSTTLCLTQSLFQFVLALLSFLSVPVLSFLLSFNKVALYHTIPFIVNFLFLHNNVGIFNATELHA